jgi:hypothetical protein
VSSREGQVWEMGNGMLFLVTGPPETAREMLTRAGDRNLGTSKTLDRMLMHPVLWLEWGKTGGLVEEKPGKWDRTKSWKRHS